MPEDDQVANRANYVHWVEDVIYSDPNVSSREGNACIRGIDM